MVPQRKLHTQIRIQIGDGVVAVGESLVLSVRAITQIVIGGKLYGQGPAKMPLPIKHVTMATTAMQKFTGIRNRKEKNEINFPCTVIF